MMNRIKEYFNGSMEPEPESVSKERPTDLGVAARVFHLIGTIMVAACIVLIPAIGLQFNFAFFGILFIGISILLKGQEQILNQISGVEDIQSQPADEAEEEV